MTTFYRGAGPGTHWHKNDACASGFTAHDLTAPHTPDQIVRHIRTGTTGSPYLSLTRSYEIAWSYATGFGKSGSGIASAASPGYVYEIVLDASAPVTVVDPIATVGAVLPAAIATHGYQHDGGPEVLLGLVSTTFAHTVHRHVRQPPPGGGLARAARITEELEAMVNALRDAELLALHFVPKAFVVRRYPVP